MHIHKKHTNIHRKGKHDNMTSRHMDKNLHNIRISRKHKTEKHERASTEIETNKFLKLVLGHQFFPDV